MCLLLDTHIFLWFVEDNPALSSTVRSLSEDGQNDLLISIVSLWEIAIKVSTGTGTRWTGCWRRRALSSNCRW